MLTQIIISAMSLLHGARKVSQSVCTSEFPFLKGRFSLGSSGSQPRDKDSSPGSLFGTLWQEASLGVMG